jgi:ABC-type transport system involved in cytochrome c biogenesis ATPase subunit/GNAT superfamily N-acetyltransferase
MKLMSNYEIKSTSAREGRKNLLLESRRGTASQLTVHRFAMVGPGDDIVLMAAGAAALRLTVKPKAKDEDGIVVVPHFQSHQELRFGDERLKIVLTEIESDDQLAEYKRLEQFHYKGVDLHGTGEDVVKGTGGRKAILLAVVSRGQMSRAVGYIEIQMPMLMCKPRHDLFGRPYENATKGVSWKTWLGDGQRHVNRIARIARVVVDPEFRGIGISTLLVEGTKTFCRERWHIGGEKPLFLEISAEMLRYMNFVSRAGFHYVGNTEGNLQRIAKDLNSMENGASGRSGIMSLQRKYHTAFTAYCNKTGRTFDEARLILSEMLAAKDPRSQMASDEWLAFRPILRFPIPYYLIGLDPTSEDYIRTGLEERKSAAGSEPSNPMPTAAETPKNVDRLSYRCVEVRLRYQIPLTPYVRLVMDSFGIETHQIRSRVLGPFDLSLSRGTVTMVTGASGAGKSILLQAISGRIIGPGLTKQVVEEPRSIGAETLSPLPDGIPIFQYFADKFGPDKAFSALCQVGLSEAMVFIKPFEVLSMGQRYRAMFASLILSDSPLWLIDEFCSNLDPITSKIISLRLRRLAVRAQRFVVVAAANSEHFVDALSPDTVLVVRTGGNVLQMRLQDFKNGFFNKGF